jgi:hypothetical protein
MTTAKKSEVATKRLLTYLPAAVIFLLGPGLTQPWTSLSKRAVANEMQKDIGEKMTPPPRDPRLAVEEEYQLALRLGTVQALELFIARHPNDPLAQKARADVRQRSR